MVRVKANLGRLFDQERCVQIGFVIISPISAVRDLGFYLDSELFMKQHGSRIAATCFLHLCRLRQYRRRIERDLTVQLIVAFISARLQFHPMQITTEHPGNIAAGPKCCSSAGVWCRAID
jgi:hypothetical protein